MVGENYDTRVASRTSTALDAKPIVLGAAVSLVARPQ